MTVEEDRKDGTQRTRLDMEGPQAKGEGDLRCQMGTKPSATCPDFLMEEKPDI